MQCTHPSFHFAYHSWWLGRAVWEQTVHCCCMQPTHPKLFACEAMFRKVSRVLLVCSLALAFSGMAYKAMSKYQKQQLGSTTMYKPQRSLSITHTRSLDSLDLFFVSLSRDFQFPTISICSYTKNATSPLVVYAKHFLNLGGGRSGYNKLL